MQIVPSRIQDGKQCKVLAQLLASDHVSCDFVARYNRPQTRNDVVNMPLLFKLGGPFGKGFVFTPASLTTSGRPVAAGIGKTSLVKSRCSSSRPSPWQVNDNQLTSVSHVLLTA